MLHFTYDYDKYEAKRGMYFDIRECLSGSSSEDGIIDILKTSILSKFHITIHGLETIVLSSLQTVIE